MTSTKHTDDASEREYDLMQICNRIIERTYNCGELETEAKIIAAALRIRLSNDFVLSRRNARLAEALELLTTNPGWVHTKAYCRGEGEEQCSACKAQAVGRAALAAAGEQTP